MAPSRTVVLYLVLVLGLGALALGRVPALERALDWLLLPARLCAELAAPVAWMQGHEVGARASERSNALRHELFEHDALEAAVLASALAPRSEHHATADCVHAEVVGRDEGRRDVLLARVEEVRGLAPGMPVVTGDWYVGLVVDVPVGPAGAGGAGVISIALITGAKARIAAIVPRGPTESPCELVVGGVAPPRSQVYLDVHQPSQRWVHAGGVEVFEPESLGEPYTPLANGYQLGELVLVTSNDERGLARTLVCIQPGLDYEAGLYQLLVLRPRAGVPGEASSRVDVLHDGQWARARLFLRAEPSFWREGRRLALGSRHGVRDGAALVSGVRLVGRVDQAGPFASSVRMLGDPGLTLVALAMVEEGDDLRPHVLGRIIGRGRASDGTLEFDWTATLPLTGDGALPARIWTGSGEAGVPRGLLLGETLLPTGPGTHRLRIRQPAGAAEPKGLAIRTSPLDRALDPDAGA